MALDDIIRSGIALADSITKSLQPTIRYEPWIGQDEYGTPRFGTRQDIRVIIEYKNKQFSTRSGKEPLIRAIIFFLHPIDANGAEDRAEPLDIRDRITLPDGTTGPILSVDGVADPDSSLPYYHAVALGWFIR
jgi:hypothetical protein